MWGGGHGPRTTTMYRGTSGPIVHFKRLDNRHVHKEIKFWKAINKMDQEWNLCKTNLILIRRHFITFYIYENCQETIA